MPLTAGTVPVGEEPRGVTWSADDRFA